MTQQACLLSDESANTRQLLLAFARSRGDRHFTEDEAVALCEAAREAEIEWTCLRLVFEGKLLVDIQDGVLAFKTP